MRKGPPRTPTAILKARGSRHIGDRKSEPNVGAGRPTMPAWLPPQAKAVWHRLVEQLLAMGVLTIADGNALARYCVTFARWRRAQLVLAAGETYETKNTAGHAIVKLRPEVMISQSLGAELSRLESEFGLTPSARAGLNVTAIFTPGAPKTTPPLPSHGSGSPTIPFDKGRFFRDRDA